MLTYFDVTLQACSAKVLKNYQTLHVGDCAGTHSFMDDHTFIFLHVNVDVFYVLPQTLRLLQLGGGGVVSDNYLHIHIYTNRYTKTPIHLSTDTHTHSTSMLKSWQVLCLSQSVTPGLVSGAVPRSRTRWGCWSCEILQIRWIDGWTDRLDRWFSYVFIKFTILFVEMNWIKTRAVCLKLSHWLVWHAGCRCRGSLCPMARRLGRLEDAMIFYDI